MRFEEQLRSHLERLEAGGPPLESRAIRTVSVPDLRKHFLARLAGQQATNSNWVRRTHTAWSPRLESFAQYIDHLPEDAAPLEQAAAGAFAAKALDVAIEVNPGTALVERLELQRVVDGFGRANVEAEKYAIENQLVRTKGPTLELSRLGAAFLRLRGRDAIRWLLTSETLQSTGGFDDWRASRELLREAATGAGITGSYDPDDDIMHYGFSQASLDRLTRLGVLWAHGEGLVERYSVRDAVTELVAATIEPGPWHATVSAMLDDERSTVFGLQLGPSATEAAVEQSRLITHEVRNALVPVRHHIDALLATGAGGPEERLHAVRRGVVRTLEFVDQMVAVSELATEPATVIELLTIVREATSWTDDAGRVDVSGDQHLRVRAPRTRLSRAVANVILNAVQAAPSPARVTVLVRSANERAQVVVDDRGAGVPAQLRQRVFEDGFTAKPGGTGFGLAFARRVIEDLHGSIGCGDNPAGGARFVIEVPRAETP